MDAITLGYPSAWSKKSWGFIPFLMGKSKAPKKTNCYLLYICYLDVHTKYDVLLTVLSHSQSCRTVRTSISPDQCSKGAVQKFAFLLLYLPLLARGTQFPDSW
jgi:hypothetical protein